ncbi:MAG: mismatch endonuclease Vsr protein [Candidatus Jorgensenbacteria bacterium GW2011_GWB1_50_10]|uniref:Mismatch endonuclease Vsr protein n=1 Tax=Candidatus Jorgensenbacteria bacterium GW2011_GWB1_50_10 TaxID=1618665 RepID=A0A0G1YIA1_9BACT|nr:MAG: mismatch endonuclease Vsr protein [Candidatus Jorgensenbacteria bacterium GW2011_GWB1_50_10]
MSYCKKCPYCGIDFVTNDRRAVFCSRHCARIVTNTKRYSLAREKLEQRLCRTCGKSLALTKALPSSQQKYCGNSCATTAKWTRPSYRFHQSQVHSTGRHFYWHVCLQCGQSFGNYIKTSISKFCSVKCKNRHQISRRLATCAYCGKNFVTLNRPKRGKFCSCRCYTLKRQAMSKETYLPSPQPKRVCLRCGKNFFDYKHPYTLLRKFCSVKCARQYAFADSAARQRMRKIRLLHVFPVKDTKIEVALQDELRKRGIKFVTHISLIICQPDIFLPEARLVVFADGDYWHGCPIHYPIPTKRQQEYIDRDSYQVAYLTRLGYRVLRFWEHEIKKDVVACVDRIVNVAAGVTSKFGQNRLIQI